MFSAAADSPPCSFSRFDRTDPDELRYPAIISVWVRRFVRVACLIEPVCRPKFICPIYIPYLLFFTLLTALNACVHSRPRFNRGVTKRWLPGLGVMDVILVSAVIVSAAIAVGGGFDFLYLLYLPPLFIFAVIFHAAPAQLRPGNRGDRHLHGCEPDGGGGRGFRLGLDGLEGPVRRSRVMYAAGGKAA